MKIADNLLEVKKNISAGYHPLVSYDKWLLAVMNYGGNNCTADNISYLEYHAQTDEAFILLEGAAYMIIAEGEETPINIQTVRMENKTAYNVKKGVWHAAVLEKDSSVAIVENSDTSKENSGYYYLSDNEKDLIKMGVLKYDIDAK